METIGSQNREKLENTEYEMLADEAEHAHFDNEGSVLLRNTKTNAIEVWFKNDLGSGYIIEIENVGYEFARCLTMNYRSVVFLQGDEGSKVVDMIDELGEDAVIQHLLEKYYDESNLLLYDLIHYLLKGSRDAVYNDGKGNVITYDSRLGYIGLEKELPCDNEDVG